MPTNRLVVKEQIATYAQILFDAAFNAGGQDGVLEVRDQATKVVSAIRENAELRSVLADSAYTPEQRASVIKGVFADANPALVEVLGVMAERCETALLSRMWDVYEGLIASKLKVCVVSVTTAVALDDRLREVIKRKAESELGMSVVLDERIDESVLGGIVMSANGERIDASVQTKVENVREALKRA
ncbi:MAG: ATP synthase F1 subunit delta [Berryella intestinalis]|uniref:ATP synthase F1 subunit delta n=1 Tax=Berryella intestinalis TaxID=1531429 RepID=UPI002A5299B3|nr:ATP synthase F1 subunit delta [Berryella intestinalis]MDD7369449.1 ATP synthase F1 subunit delta [Berryella intestinalis]MDY3129531.1 ATP synthase F1 subunit delta [Berryella intestinalis]